MTEHQPPENKSLVDDNLLGLIGTDASGLDAEFYESDTSEDEPPEPKTSVLGRLGTSGYYQVIPDRINQRQRGEQ